MLCLTRVGRRPWGATSESGWFLALIYCELGEKDRALARLDEAYKERDGVDALKADPAWDPLRSDPRFIGAGEAPWLPAVDSTTRCSFHGAELRGRCTFRQHFDQLLRSVEQVVGDKAEGRLRRCVVEAKNDLVRGFIEC